MASATVNGHITPSIAHLICPACTAPPSNAEVRRCTIQVSEGSTGFVVGTASLNGFLNYTMTIDPVNSSEIYHWSGQCADPNIIISGGIIDFQLFDGTTVTKNGNAFYATQP